ncbi:unnamed protein product [Pleuronectes platessa]|uniref:Uncharacterized protein n=1 Tax=Pleuronectes platessa TaxID=8262 RepID=A0A9N7Z5Z6_PLEPL|nr:unnamed protein product [Pleuronectes platessa]
MGARCFLGFSKKKEAERRDTHRLHFKARARGGRMRHSAPARLTLIGRASAAACALSVTGTRPLRHNPANIYCSFPWWSRSHGAVQLQPSGSPPADLVILDLLPPRGGQLTPCLPAHSSFIPLIKPTGRFPSSLWISSSSDLQPSPALLVPSGLT